LQTRFSFRSVEQTFGARGKLASLLFGCCAICDVCHVRCVLPRGHKGAHRSCAEEHACRPTADRDNVIWYCRQCHNEGRGFVRARWADVGAVNWALRGSQIECEHCGVIFSSREQWSDLLFTKDPTPLLIEGHCHMSGALRWIDGEEVISGSCAAQDAVSMLSTCTAMPLSAAGSLIHQTTTAIVNSVPQLSEPGWEQGSECSICNEPFSSTVPRHHCRACLRSVCNNHSMQRRAVPKRHHPEAVRVCDECILKKVCDDTQLTEPVPALRSTLDAVSSISNSVYTPCKQLATSLVRPSYWEADEAVEFCGQHSQGGCKQRFDNEVLMKHHCRVCGLIFCDGCCGHYHHTPLFTLAQRTCNLCHSEIVCQ